MCKIILICYKKHPQSSYCECANRKSNTNVSDKHSRYHQKILLYVLFFCGSVLLIFFYSFFVLSFYVYLRSEFRVVMTVTMFGSSLPPVVCRSDQVLCTLFVLFAHCGVKPILCCVFVLFVFIVCALCYQFLWIFHF